jgi:hypothetical protein
MFSTSDRGYSAKSLHNEEKVTLTNSFKVQPFAKGKYGKATFEQGQTRELRSLNYDDEGETQYLGETFRDNTTYKTDSKGSTKSEVVNGVPVSETASFNIDSSNISLVHEMISTISYDNNQDYYTTTGITGSPKWYVTSQMVQRVLNGRLREIKTWITSASYDEEFERSVVYPKINDGTIVSQNQEKAITITTRNGRTATKTTISTFNKYDDILVNVVNVFPYNKKDSNGVSLEDSVFVLTQTTFSKAELFTWFKSEQRRPECLSLIERSYAFDDTNYHIVHESIKETKEQKRQHKSLSWSVPLSKEKTYQLNWIQGVASSTKDIPRITKSTEGTEETKTTWSIKSGKVSEKVGLPPEFSIKQDDAQALNHKFALSNTQGGWSIQNDLTKTTATMQTSVLIEAFMPWVESLHYVNTNEKIGGWRSASDASGIVLDTELTQVTTEEGLTIVQETGPAGSDTKKTEIPAQTEERKFHVYSQSEAVPLFAHVLPSTSTFEKLGFQPRETEYPFEYAETYKEYEEPITYTERDSKFNRITITSYSGTTEEDVSNDYTSQSEIFTMFEPYKTSATAENSIETNRENGETYNTTRSGIETSEGNISQWYADFLDAYTQISDIEHQKLDKNGSTEFSQNILKTTRIYAPIFVDTIEGSQSFHTFSSVVLKYGEIQSSLSEGEVTTEASVTITEIDGEEEEIDITISTFKQSHNIIRDTSNYTQSSESGFSKQYNQFEYALHGSIEHPYIIMHTAITGLDGIVALRDNKNTGEIQGNTSTESTYSAINYLGIEEQDFHPYRNAYKVTTQVYEGANTYYHKAYDCIGKIKIQSSQKTTFEYTYHEPTTITWYLDQGFIEWCGSDYDDAIKEANEAWMNDLGYQSTDCVEVIYSDGCGYTSMFGLFGSENSFDGGSGFGSVQTFYNNDGEIVDEFGNIVYEDGNYIGGNPNEDNIRDPACDPFTWTWISTHHESSMTYTNEGVTDVITELEPIDMIPYWQGNQFYFGNLAYYEELYTTADILLPEKNWKSPRKDYDQRYAQVWLSAIFENNDNNEIISNKINGGTYRIAGEGALTSPRLLENLYMDSVPTSSVQPCVGSQILRSFTTYAHDLNEGLYPQYQNTIVGNNLFNNRREYRRYFVDEKRRNDKFALTTKQFQSGVYGKLLFGNIQESKTYDDVIVMESESINPIFFTDSNFYKQWLENTHITLTYSGTQEWDTGAWFYKTQSKKVSTLISGADGKYRPIYESGTSGTQEFTISYQQAESTTYLNGNFILQTTNGTALQGLNIYTYAHPNCCRCATYDIWDRWRNLGRQFTEVGSLDYQGQWRLKNEQVVGDRVMTINFLGIATAVNDKEYTNFPIELRISTKHLTANSWISKSYFVDGANPSSVLDNALLSYEVPEAFIVNQKHIVGLIKTQSVYTIQPFISVERPVLYDEYERIECFVGKKDPFLNRHLVHEVLDPFFEENKHSIFDYAIDRRAKRNRNLPNQYIPVRVANQDYNNTQAFDNMEINMRNAIEADHRKDDFDYYAISNDIFDAPKDEDE